MRAWLVHVQELWRTIHNLTNILLIKLSATLAELHNILRMGLANCLVSFNESGVCVAAEEWLQVDGNMKLRPAGHCMPCTRKSKGNAKLLWRDPDWKLSEYWLVSVV